jgi:G3E family GTPase
LGTLFHAPFPSSTTGKTTLLNWILTQPHGKRIAVIENEFGQGLGIESVIAKDGADGSSLEGFFELANGCICCSVKSDLLATLEVLVQRKAQFDYVIIETSGLADPGPVASCLWVDEELESQLQLDGIVTVVDAKHIGRHLVRRPAAPEGPTTDGGGGGGHGDEAKEYHQEEAYRQICVADRLLLNKTDLVPATELVALEAQLRGLNGMARMQHTVFSKVDLDFVLGLDCYGDKGKEDQDLPFLPLPSSSSASYGEEGGGGHGHSHSHGSDGAAAANDVTTFALVEKMEVDAEAVKRWLAELLWRDDDEDEDKKGGRGSPQQIYRMKGTLAVAGSEVLHILQAVHETFEVEPCQTPLAQELGPKECRLVVIGKGLDERALRAGFLATAAPPTNPEK